MVKESIGTNGELEMSIKAGTAGTIQTDAILFRWLPFILLFGVALLCGYETIMQRYMPDYSLLAHLHSHGMMTGQQVLYKPSRSIWRWMGWIGSAMMMLLMLYSVRKRVRFLNSLGALKYWLRGHIFLGLMGPLLITFHTTFKFNGLVATSFWAMIVTMCFGILGRYIYIQIPRSISGMELKEQEIEAVVMALDADLKRRLPDVNIASIMESFNTPGAAAKGMAPLKALLFCAKNDLRNFFMVASLRGKLKSEFGLSWRSRREIVVLFRKKAALIRRKMLLSTSHDLLHYWHVLHIPLAILMFSIMFIHIVAYFLFTSTI